jgi:NADPH2 dehydrogenase
MMVEYYAQRASVPGTLLVTEGTFISAAHGGYDNVPGIYNAAQIAAWRKVTDAVHEKGSFIFCQIWALGRTANPKVMEREGQVVRSSSAAQLSPDHAVPEEMTKEQIQQAVADYAQAAKNAIEAGFDGVELHGANGYLIDQFIQDKVNQRTDEYGGSVGNRSRFAVEAVKAVVEAIGADRTGIRLSPYNDFQGMGMYDPVPQFTDVIRKLNPLGLAFIHLVLARAGGTAATATYADPEKIDVFVEAFDGTVLIAGGLTAESAQEALEKQYPDRDVVAVFGRYFISTPDLPFRVKKGIQFNEYNRATFYTPKDPVGYVDYPFSQEFLSNSRL